MADQVPPEKLARYKELIESHPEITLKGGKNYLIPPTMAICFQCYQKMGVLDCV